MKNDKPGANDNGEQSGENSLPNDAAGDHIDWAQIDEILRES
jgi:hypothetical protein